MAITSADVDRTLQRIMNKVQQGQWGTITTGLSTPQPKLMSELGPLTEKTLKDSTVDAAVMLACTVAKTDQTFLNALDAVRSSLVSSTILATSGSVDSGMTLNFSVENLRVAVAGAVSDVKASNVTTAPILVQLLDVLIIQSVAAIPFVGPALSGLLGGMAGGIAAGFTYGGNAVATLFTAQDTKANPNNPITGVSDNWQGFGSNTAKNVTKGVSGVVAKDAVFSKQNPGTIQGMVESIGDGKGGSGWGMDLSKASQSATGVASFIYFLHNNRSSRGEKDRVKGLQAKTEGELQTMVGGLNYVQNPLTQNQVAANAQVNVQRGIRQPPPEVKVAGDTIKSKLQLEDNTLSEFFEKVPDVFDAYKKYLMALAYANTIESFQPMIEAFDRRVDDMKISMKNPRLATILIDNPQTRDANVVALLIMGYYFNRVLKVLPKVQEAFDYDIKRYYRTQPGGPGVVGAPSSFANVALNDASAKIISTFKDTQKAGQLSIDKSNVEWSQIQTKSSTYVALVKSALLNEMALEFSRALSNRKTLDQMVQLTIACSLIVNDVMVASTAKKKIEINDRYVAILAKLGYVNLYTKIMIVTESRKAELTGSGKTAMLRYPKPGRLSTSASEAERSMVYLFACCVLAYVDVGKVVMGYQDWSTTVDRLHELIDEINKAEKD